MNSTGFNSEGEQFNISVGMILGIFEMISVYVTATSSFKICETHFCSKFVLAMSV